MRLSAFLLNWSSSTENLFLGNAPIISAAGGLAIALQTCQLRKIHLIHVSCRLLLGQDLPAATDTGLEDKLNHYLHAPPYFHTCCFPLLSGPGPTTRFNLSGWSLRAINT
jgi:hypothetical protein